MHAMPAKYCELTKLGKKLYTYLKLNGMVQYIENNYSTGNNKDFVNKFIAKFNLKLPEDGEIEKINNNQRRKIASHPQEINNFSLAISNVKFQDFSKMNKSSRSLYDEVIETYKFSDNQVLALLSEEYQTILDIIKNHRIINREIVVAIRAKLIELVNSRKIREALINGNTAWRLRNY